MSENKTKLGQEPAFPSESKDVVIGRSSCNVIDENGREQILYQNQFGKEVQSGMSKRFYAACCAMQGIMSSNECGVGHSPVTAVKWAYAIADELLTQENAE